MRTRKVEFEFSPQYRTIHMDAVYALPNEANFEIFLLRHETDPTETLRRLDCKPAPEDEVHVKRIAECRLLMDPLTAKNVIDLLSQQISLYEKVYGEIKTQSPGQSLERRGISTMIS